MASGTQPLSNLLNMSIPGPFLCAGTKGTLLRLVPVEHLRGKESPELYFKSGPSFTLGRSPEADWVTCFFPRSEKNDQRSKRISKIHARIEFHDERLWIYRTGSAALHVNDYEIGPEPARASVADRDRIVVAEDYGVNLHYDVSLQGAFKFANGDSWQAGKIELNSGLPGAIRFEPINSALGIRNACWLFVDVGFGSAQVGGLKAGAELAPHQGTILLTGGCFWILNSVNNDKVSVNDYLLMAREVIPLTQNDSIWLGAVRYRAEIN